MAARELFPNKLFSRVIAMGVAIVILSASSMEKSAL
jgi:hypothetical protein